MKNCYRLILLLVFLLISLSGCKLATSPEIRIGMIADHSPWESQNAEGNPEGITVDLIKAFSAYAKEEVKILWYEPGSIYKALSNGEIDCAMSSLPITEENQSLFQYTDPYTKTFPVLLIGNDSPIISKQQLNHQSANIAVIENSVYAKLARSEYSNANISEYSNRTEAVEAVRSGASDCLIDDALSVVNIYKNSPEAFRVNPAPLTDKFQYYTVYVGKDQGDLKEKWNDFFATKRNEKYFDELYNKYIAPDENLLLKIDIAISL